MSKQNQHKPNVPELRFPEFSGEWEEKNFGDITKVNQGLQIAISERKTEYSPGLYFYITNEFLKENNKVKYYIEQPQSSVIAQKEDILMTRTGNTGKVITNVEGAFHNNFFKIKFDKSKINRLFLYEILRHPKINNQFLSLAGTSTIPDLNHSDFYSVGAFYPKYQEQQKIGDFFGKLDRQIELEEKKLALLEEQKKGYMQKIFSRELRFKDENGDDYPEWEEQKLGDLANIIRGAFPRPIKDPKWFDENSTIGWLRISDVTNQNGRITYLEQYISKLGEEKTRVLKSPHLLLSIAATVGKPVINYVETGVHDGFLIFQSPKFDIDYLFHWLECNRNIWKRYGQPGSQVNLNSEIVKEQRIQIGCIEEQKRISLFLNKLDDLIDNNKNKLKLMVFRKSTLLKKMMV
ncbi:restriction endonuclease subunit S [Staphylococcus simulans]